MTRPPTSSPPIPVDRSCTIADHESIKTSGPAWKACTSVGFQSYAGTTYELRNCPRCGSTMNRAAEVVVVRYLDEPPSAPATAQKPRKHAPQIAAEARGAA